VLTTPVPAVGETRDVLVFTHAVDHWQIDAVIKPPDAPPKATGTRMRAQVPSMS
jgi:hypothetical protein